MAVIALTYDTNETTTRPLFPGGAFAITPSDTDTFAGGVTVYVGGAGTVTILPANGGAAVSFTMVAGGVVPCQAIAVKSTGTAATLLVAVY